MPNSDRSRPNLKIQDGCHNRCSFCVIPFVRGKSRYVGADEVVAQVRAIAATYREVVLSGINLGRWGRESGSPMRLPDLLRRLLAETPIQRIRLKFGRANGFFRRSAGSDGRLAAHREARPRPAAVGIGRHPAPHAPQVPAPPLCRPRDEGAR